MAATGSKLCKTTRHVSVMTLVVICPVEVSGLVRSWVMTVDVSASASAIASVRWPQLLCKLINRLSRLKAASVPFVRCTKCVALKSALSREVNNALQSVQARLRHVPGVRLLEREFVTVVL